MTGQTDPKEFWENKILAWEESRYGMASSGFGEKLAGLVSTSLRFRLQAAVRMLAPYVVNRPIVELGCGSGLLAEQLVSLGAESYRGIDISEKAIMAARERTSSSGVASKVSFEAGRVSDLPSLGNAVVLSLGLFDWLTPAEIDHVFRIGKDGSYFHAVAEKRHSLHQLVHRLYVHLSYGYRSGSYVPQYHTIAEINAAAGRSGLAAVNVYRDSRMRFGIFVTDFQAPASPVEI